MEAHSGNSMLFHVVRLQEDGLSIPEIQGWFERFDMYGIDVEALVAEAAKLTPAERTAMVEQSRRVTQEVNIGIAFGSVVGTLVIGWIFVGIATLLPILEGFTGGAIGAGLKIGNSIHENVKVGKPTSVIVGSIIGFLLLAVSYAIFVGGITFQDLITAILMVLLSSWYLWRTKPYIGKESGCFVAVVMSLIYFGLVYLVMSW